MQDQHVVECGQEGRVQQGVVLAARHLADDDLRVRGGADDLVGVAGGDAGDVRPVRLQGRGVVILVRVVVGEGDFVADPRAPVAWGRLGASAVTSACIMRREAASRAPEKAGWLVSRPER